MNDNRSDGGDYIPAEPQLQRKSGLRDEIGTDEEGKHLDLKTQARSTSVAPRLRFRLVCSVD